MTTNNLKSIYETLYNHYGPQHWWPGNSTFEIMVGAVLTQNTNWTNVEKAINNLKNANMLSLDAFINAENETIAELIRPAGYFNVKTKRLKNLCIWLAQMCDGDLDSLKDLPLYSIREQLLEVKGIGRETADSILLYALDMPTFVVDTYTYRILTRHMMIEPEADYDELRSYFMSSIDNNLQLFNEFHALIVQIGKNHCKPKAKCQGCPLQNLPHQLEEESF